MAFVAFTSGSVSGLMFRNSAAWHRICKQLQLDCWVQQAIQDSQCWFAQLTSDSFVDRLVKWTVNCLSATEFEVIKVDTHVGCLRCHLSTQGTPNLSSQSRKITCVFVCPQNLPLFGQRADAEHAGHALCQSLPGPHVECGTYIQSASKSRLIVLCGMRYAYPMCK